MQDQSCLSMDGIQMIISSTLCPINKTKIRYCRPDLPQLWSALIEEFQKEYYCVTLELPNYNNNRVQNKWGYDLVDISRAVAYTVQERILLKSPYSQVTLVIHDWGALIGFVSNKFYPLLYNRIAAIDVGDNGRSSEWTTFQKSFTVAYQWYNIIAHFSFGPIGDFMTRSAASYFGTPLAKTNQTNKINGDMI